METENSAARAATETADYPQFDFYRFASADGGGDRIAEKRMNDFPAQAARGETENFYSFDERLEAELMMRPLSPEKVFARFGLMLGAFPPAAIFGRLFLGKGVFRLEDVWIFGVVLVICLIASTVGYFTGKKVGRAVARLETTTWTRMLLALPLVGAVWGIAAGAAGGVIIFVFGAFFGAVAGGAVGAVALPAFTIFHRLLKTEDRIEEKHFLPLAVGTTLAISAFFLGL